MDILRRDPPLSHVTTFGGHPVSRAAAYAALEVLLEEDLPARAMEMRGRGAMLGMELTSRDVTQ